MQHQMTSITIAFIIHLDLKSFIEAAKSDNSMARLTDQLRFLYGSQAACRHHMGFLRSECQARSSSRRSALDQWTGNRKLANSAMTEDLQATFDCGKSLAAMLTIGKPTDRATAGLAFMAGRHRPEMAEWAWNDIENSENDTLQSMLTNRKPAAPARMRICEYSKTGLPKQ